MSRRFGLPILAAALLIACATILVASHDFNDANVQLVQVQVPLSVTQKLRHAVRQQPRDPAAYWPVFPQLYALARACVRACVFACACRTAPLCCPHPSPSYSLNLVNGRVVGQTGDYSPKPAALEATQPLLQRIRAAKLLKEKVSSMLQDAGNIDAQAKALRSQASYARQQAADVKAEEDALRSKLMEVGSQLKVQQFSPRRLVSQFHNPLPPPDRTHISRRAVQPSQRLRV